MPPDDDALPVPASEPVPEVGNADVVRTYDRFATAYDWLVAPLERGTRERAIALLGVDDGHQVVEVGCGPGFALALLGERVGPDGRAVGVDAAPSMVRQARRRVARGGVGGWTDVSVGDARSLPVPAGSTDAVFIEDTLELFDADDRAATLEEAARVLRDGGRLGVVTMERDAEDAARFVRAWDWAFERVPRFERVGCRPVEARSAVRTAGFDVRIEEHHERLGVWPVELLIATLRE